MSLSLKFMLPPLFLVAACGSDSQQPPEHTPPSSPSLQSTEAHSSDEDNFLRPQIHEEEIEFTPIKPVFPSTMPDYTPTPVILTAPKKEKIRRYTRTESTQPSVITLSEEDILEKRVSDLLLNNISANEAFSQALHEEESVLNIKIIYNIYTTNETSISIDLVKKKHDFKPAQLNLAKENARRIVLEFNKREDAHVTPQESLESLCEQLNAHISNKRFSNTKGAHKHVNIRAMSDETDQSEPPLKKQKF